MRYRGKTGHCEIEAEDISVVLLGVIIINKIINLFLVICIYARYLSP